MCWNDWTTASKNCATRKNNARYKFPSIVIASSTGDATLTVDVHCICKKRVDLPMNTRLDTWVHVHHTNVPVAANPANNNFLESQIDEGATGMCFPGYKSGTYPKCKRTYLHMSLIILFEFIYYREINMHRLSYSTMVTLNADCDGVCMCPRMTSPGQNWRS